MGVRLVVRFEMDRPSGDSLRTFGRVEGAGRPAGVIGGAERLPVAAVVSTAPLLEGIAGYELGRAFGSGLPWDWVRRLNDTVFDVLVFVFVAAMPMLEATRSAAVAAATAIGTGAESTNSWRAFGVFMDGVTDRVVRVATKSGSDVVKAEVRPLGALGSVAGWSKNGSISST